MRNSGVSEGTELLHIVLLLSFFHSFVEIAEFTVGFQLGLVATDCLNEFLHILDCRWCFVVRFIYFAQTPR